MLTVSWIKELNLRQGGLIPHLSNRRAAKSLLLNHLRTRGGNKYCPVGLWGVWVSDGREVISTFG